MTPYIPPYPPAMAVPAEVSVHTTSTGVSLVCEGGTVLAVIPQGRRNQNKPQQQETSQTNLQCLTTGRRVSAGGKSGSSVAVPCI